MSDAAVSADAQHAGRGRRERKWLSPKGNLYLSLGRLLKTADISPSAYPVSAAISMTDYLRDTYGVDVYPKWPNDLMVDNSKLCGMLSEHVRAMNGDAHVIVGIGLNVNQDVSPNAAYSATSLSALLKRPLELVELRHAIIAAVWMGWERLENEGVAGLADRWLARANVIGKRVTVQTLTKTIDGKVQGMDPDFALVLESEGVRVRVIEGDCLMSSQTGG